MKTDIATIPSAQLKALVVNLPSEKRAAFSKAAKAAAQHMRDSKANYGKAYELASAMVENWWRLGLELPRLGITQGSGMKKRSPQGDNVLLEQLGINRNQSARCQKLAAMSKFELDHWLESHFDAESYWLPSLKPASETHLSENTGNPEWYTPPDYIEAARAVLGQIDLDPASSDKAQDTVGAVEYFTMEDDGLKQDWAGRVWMNPPYASGIVDHFMLKLKQHVDDKDVSAAITLTNNSTDTAWFQACSKSAVCLCLVSPRIKFLDESGEAKGTPLQGQAVLYFGRAPKRFIQAFSEIGHCWGK